MPGKFLIFLVLILLAAACQRAPINTELLSPTDADAPSAPILDSTPTQEEILKPTAIPSLHKKQMSFGLTYHNADGNRIIPGSGKLPFQKPIDIQLSGTPLWVIATPHNDGVMWTAAIADGRTYSYFMRANGSIIGEPLQFDVPAGMPPAAISAGSKFSLVVVPDPDQSPITHPIYLPLSDQRAYITRTGQINFMDASDQIVGSLDVHALPDARILRDDNDRLLVLSDPTGKYDHGVLGDQLEAASITLIATQPEPTIVSRITLEENEVIEGIAPIWADMTGDNQPEIIVTVSDLNQGAGIVIFSENGERIAEGPKMGQPYRWRHQIAVSEFGTNRETELAVVRTPHIGGTVEFYQLKDGELIVAAEFPGITSHTIGSRNLDLTAAGDFAGDGLSELLVLSPDLSEYIAVRRTPTGAEEVWRLPLDGIISSNLAGASLPDGNLIIGAGRSDNVLRIWLPQE